MIRRPPRSTRTDNTLSLHDALPISLLPLLIGDVVVRRLVAVEPDILLEVDAGGRGNWEFAVAAAPAPEAPPEESARVTLPDVQDFRIEGGVLRLVDATTGESLQLDVTGAIGSRPGQGDGKSGGEGKR